MERQRVVCYVTRGRELLVFSHADPGLEAGLQVVAGGVDEGESLEQAAVREVWEEAGLRLEGPVYLGSLRRRMPPDFPTRFPVWHQHYFWLTAPPDTPDEWLHTVSGGAADQGMIYQQHFVPLRRHGLTQTLEAFLPQLEERL